MEPSVSPVIENIEVHTQLKEDATPSKLSRETLTKIDIVKEEILV